MFPLQGLPSVVLGFVTRFYLTGAPAEAKWLCAEERTWLDSRLKSEAARKDGRSHLLSP
jgi:hypothetical protein